MKTKKQLAKLWEDYKWQLDMLTKGEDVAGNVLIIYNQISILQWVLK